MKTTLLTLALVAAAGVATAQTASAPQGGSTGTILSNGIPIRGTTQVEGVQLGTGSQAQMNGNAAGAAASPNMANAPSQSLTGAARTAQKRIEQDGYKGVQNLQQGSDGLWHGTATRGSTSVQVTVDRTGRVSAQ